MQGVSVFFDTNVLVYVHDELSPFHEHTVLLLEPAIQIKALKNMDSRMRGNDELVWTDDKRNFEIGFKQRRG